MLTLSIWHGIWHHDIFPLSACNDKISWYNNTFIAPKKKGISQGWRSSLGTLDHWGTLPELHMRGQFTDEVWWPGLGSSDPVGDRLKKLHGAASQSSGGWGRLTWKTQTVVLGSFIHSAGCLGHWVGTDDIQGTDGGSSSRELSAEGRRCLLGRQPCEWTRPRKLSIYQSAFVDSSQKDNFVDTRYQTSEGAQSKATAPWCRKELKSDQDASP